MNDSYIPGVCNIGNQEIARRYRSGWVGLLVAILLAVSMRQSHAAAYWRLFLFFPVAMSVIGFFQARTRFCVAYGIWGIFSFGKSPSESKKITDEMSRNLDRKKATLIISVGVLVGAVVSTLAYFFLGSF
jgi:hypothetical protein